MKSTFFIFLILWSYTLQASDEQIDSFSGLDASSLLSSEIELFKWQAKMKDDSWQNITFPYFQAGQTELALRTAFKLTAGIDSLPLLVIADGISGSCAIYLNGQATAFHPNDTGPFFIKLPQTNIKNENLLELILESSTDVESGFPGYVQNYTEQKVLGIKQVPRILIKREKIVQNFKIELDKIEKKAKLVYSYNLNLPESKYKYRIDEVFYPHRFKRTRFVSAGNTTISGKLSTSINNLWTPENPVLMRTQIKISGVNKTLFDETYNYGLRDLKLRADKIFLNGEQIIIRGINYYNNSQRIKTKDYWQILTSDFRAIKQLGFNAVRLPHYLPDLSMLQIADSIGLLLFAELPIQRFPQPLFYSDALLENAKSAISNLSLFTAFHPSLAAIGLGQELSLTDAATQKFMFILKDMAHRKLNILTYVSPIPKESLPIEKIADFYMFDVYRPLHKYPKDLISDKNVYLLAGKVGCVRNEPATDWDNDPASQEKIKFLKREFDVLYPSLNLQGGFVDSYMDWRLELPNHQSVHNDNKEHICPSGLYDIQGRAKHWLEDLTTLWDDKSSELLAITARKADTNFFSLLVVFSSLLFFAIYRKQPRMNENMRKAIRHPYGFFVDMRERRIIPLFNSFWVGGYAAILLGVIFSSTIYYNHDSYIIQEISAVFLAPMGLYESYLTLSSNPYYLTLIVFLLLLFYPIFVSFVLKIIAIIGGERIRYRQGLAIGLWSGVPLLFLLPLSLFNYQILLLEKYQTYLALILLFFVIWAHYRIINGIRVLFITKLRKVLAAMLLSYLIPLIIFWTVFKPTTHWLEYLDLLIQARSLF